MKIWEVCLAQEFCAEKRFLKKQALLEEYLAKAERELASVELPSNPDPQLYCRLFNTYVYYTVGLDLDSIIIPISSKPLIERIKDFARIALALATMLLLVLWPILPKNEIVSVLILALPILTALSFLWRLLEIRLGPSKRQLKIAAECKILCERLRASAEGSTS